MAVAQAVVDEREEMTRRRDASDVAAPAFTDTGLDRRDPPVTHRTRDRFDGYRPVVEPHTHGTTWGPWWNVERWTPRT